MYYFAKRPGLLGFFELGDFAHLDHAKKAFATFVRLSTDGRVWHLLDADLKKHEEKKCIVQDWNLDDIRQHMIEINRELYEQGKPLLVIR